MDADTSAQIKKNAMWFRQTEIGSGGGLEVERQAACGVENEKMTFHEVYRRHADDVYRFALWLTGNPDDARDITSETFVRAWTAPEEPRMETIKAYLFTIARNLHRKQWKRSARFAPMTPEEENRRDERAQPDEAAARREEFAAALAAVQALPEQDRTALLMRAQDEMSYEDIAAATGLSAAAVRVRVFRARAKLAALLRPKGDGK